MTFATQIRSLNRGSSILFPIEPLGDESIRGYLARAADWNCLDSRTDLLRFAGLICVRRDLSDRIAERLNAVAGILGIRPASLERILNRSHPEDHAIVDFFGEKICRYRFDFRARRVSPASLRISAHHRARWHLRTLSFCPESWEALIEICPSPGCRKPLRWAGCLQVDRCEHCEFDLKSAVTDQIPEGLRPSLGFVADLLHPEAQVRSAAAARLPSPLNSIGIGDLFELICIVGRALMPEERKSNNSLEEIAPEHLARAADLFLDYPKTLDAIALEGSAPNRTTPPIVVRLRRRAKEKAGVVRSILLAMADRCEAIDHGPARLARIRRLHGMWTLGRSAEWLGLSKADLKKVVDAGYLDPGEVRGVTRRLACFQPSEITALGVRLRRRMSASEFIASYRLPLAGLEQLIACELIELCDEPVVGLLHPGWQVDRLSVLRLIDQLADALVPPLPDSVALEDIFNGIGGREKPWASIVRAALAGEIPGGLGIDPEEPLHFTRLRVSGSFGQALVAGRFPEFLELPARPEDLGEAPPYSRLDAQRYLNCFPRDLAWLLSEGHLIADEAGVVGIARVRVEALGRQVISSREINWRWRVSPRLREALPHEHGIGRTLGPFWSRAAIEEYFARMFPTGMTA